MQRNTLAPAEFTLVLNGEKIGAFNTNATQAIIHRYAESTPTVGAQCEGTWSTVVNQSVRKNSTRGQNSFTFTARQTVSLRTSGRAPFYRKPDCVYPTKLYL